MTIGIVDSGIDSTSPEFSGRISAASRDVAGSRGLSNSDSDHGTNVAMVAAAARDNTGIMGIAFGATIAMFRADEPGSCATADPNVKDSGCKFLDSDIAQGINAAIAAGARVINLSLGGSAPGTGLSNAVASAAANNVVVVISAGNNGASTDPAIDPNNPDPFAAGLRAAGNGNVIIGGSVDANNVISSFSNRAGSEATWFLSARGERVCCVYKNGSMEVVSNADGTQSVYVFSGTSFSVPQIVGAVALLRQAFPNLTATQVVDLLLRTATDGGAAGTDPIYGRGILNITAAFAPQGATSLAGSTTAMPLGDSTGVTSAAMGDAATAAGSGIKAIILDAYNRAYQVDLSAGISPARIAPRLAPALELETRRLVMGTDQYSLAFSIDDQNHASRLPWSGHLRLSDRDAQQSRVLAGRIISRLSAETQIALAFAQGTDGLVSALQGRSEPGFLIARSPLDDVGFQQDSVLGAAVRQRLGPWGLSLAMQRGTTLAGAPYQSATSAVPQNRFAVSNRFSLVADRDFGALRGAMGLTWLRESDTMLGARFHDGLVAGGADSLFVDVNGQWHIGGGWQLASALRGGMTWAHSGLAAASGGRLITSAWSLDLAHDGLFDEADSIGLRLSQPLRVESGGLALNLPVSYSYSTLQPAMATETLSLSPHSREIDTELMWRGALQNGTAMVSLFYRKNPGHFAAMPDDKGMAASWVRKF